MGASRVAIQPQMTHDWTVVIQMNTNLFKLPIWNIPPSGFPGEGPDLERLSGPGIRAFFRIAEIWGLSLEEQTRLLGGVSRSTLQRWKNAQDAQLTEDQLERISHVLGIYKALQILLPTSGDTWVKAENSEPLFQGRKGLEIMTKGGIGGLKFVRSYLDAQRGGWA